MNLGQLSNQPPPLSVGTKEDSIILGKRNEKLDRLPLDHTFIIFEAQIIFLLYLLVMSCTSKTLSIIGSSEFNRHISGNNQPTNMGTNTIQVYCNNKNE